MENSGTEAAPQSTPNSLRATGPHSTSMPSMAPTPVAVGHPVLEVVRGELERLFSIDELLNLSAGSLGIAPTELGGSTAKGAFARALVDYCAEHDALEALVDAVLIEKAEVDPRVREIAANGLAHADELATGAVVGPFTITKKLGEGGVGVVYLATRDEDGHHRQVTLKIVKREAARDMRALQRFLTANRLVGAVQHPGLPRNVESGSLADGKMYVAYDYIEGQTLMARLGRTGPMHVNEARPFLRGVLEALVSLHEKRLCHGDLKTENVLIAKADVQQAGAPPRVVLIDFGTDRLRARGRTALHQTGILAVYGSAKAMAPELVRGHVADAKSDVYAFGALLWEVLTGKALFSKPGSTSLEVALAHLAEKPEAPSAYAPRGWVSKELDAFVLDLLQKEATARPADARAVLESLDRFGRAANVSPEKTAEADRPKLSDDDVDLRIAELVERPEDGDAAAALEKAIEEGGSAERIADGFQQIAEGLDGEEKKEIRRSMLFRAARIFETSAKNADRAEAAYKRLLELDPEDEIAQAAIEELKKSTGQWSDVVEMLLSRVENVAHGRERAAVYAEIGRLYEHELEDAENAFVAYVQAFCEEPRENEYGRDVERLAGNNEESWDEALGQATHRSQTEGVSQDDKLALYVQMGKWFIARVNRLDLALPSFQAAIAIDPANDVALEGLCEVYRRAQQWPELGMVLMRRADASTIAAKARDLRAQAAEILENKLSDPNKAKDLYHAIVNEDPGHAAAVDGLERLCQRTGDFAAMVKVVEARAAALRGREKADALCRIGEIFEDQLGDLPEAIRRYDAVLALDARHLGALKGLDRIYNRRGNYKELLANLNAQIDAAATPRQKIGLWERIAAIHDEEFLDHAAAAEAYEQILKIDGAHDSALTALVRHYRALDRWEDVAALYERHLKIIENPQRRVEVLLARGRVLQEQIGSPERAMAVYEKVLEASPQHAGALEALAHLRESTGDANSAVAAVEALAAKATTPEAKAEQYIRAARLLEGRGDKDGAIERYKLALDANPNDKSAAAALRAAFAARGDVSAAIAMIEREVAIADTKPAKAKLWAEMAQVAREKLKDDDKAREAALKALDADPMNIAALIILGDTAFEAERYVEAVGRFDLVANRAESITHADAVRVLSRYVDALIHVDNGKEAIKAAEKLRQLAPEDGETLERVGKILFDHGDSKASVDLHKELIEHLGDKLTGSDRGAVLYRLGEGLRRIGELDSAIGPLEESADLDTLAVAPLDSLVKIYEAQDRWNDVVAIKRRRLDIAEGAEHVKLILEIGDILAGKLKDRAGAAKQYVAALDERPDDRGIMLKLMQMYSESEDWSQLVEVVLRLGELAEDPVAKSKYLTTAAIVTDRHIKDPIEAAALFEKVVAVDPKNDKALTEAIRLRSAEGDHVATERLLLIKLDRAKTAADKAAQIAAYDALGDVRHRHLDKVDEAIEAYEAAQALDPEGRERAETLANIYASDASRWLDKAVKAQSAILKRNPYRAESFKLLRKLYTQSKRADAAWCVCQVLTTLKLAEPDEERFFKRHRAEGPAPAQSALNAEDWNSLIRHPDRDPLLTSVIALIEPAIIASRGVTLQAEGYDLQYAVDVANDQYPMSQTLYYACGVLGLEMPIVFHNPNLPGGLAFVHASPRAVALGRAALDANVPPQAAAFVAAQKLAYFTPGQYVRQLVATSAGLKAWLFGAIKLASPNFPIAPELEGPVAEAVKALQALHPNQREQLNAQTGKLLQSGTSIDLKKWNGACDLTADRAGFLLTHDLETALTIVKAGEDPNAPVSVKDRIKELTLFAASEDYFALRQKLGIGIDN
jgi:serine/threonine protein kinase/lipopolysaccharide biosynthesis regulator YciM